MPKKRRPRRLINRYARTRIYDVATLSYVSLDRLRELHGEGFEVVVRDVETGAYVTQDVLRPSLDG